MFSETRAQAPSTKRSKFPGSRWLKAHLQITIFVLACITLAAPAIAGTAFDGDWSVVIATSGGACDPTFRYPVAISNGAIVNAGGTVASVQGQVRPNGSVRVRVESGNQWADGSGRLGMNRGSGVWKGQGSSGACEGTWVAMRRGAEAYSERSGRPIYNYVPETAAAPVESPRAAIAACEARFHSYDPVTGTYLGVDGARHPCP
jgi:BA14K-like protein